MIARDCLVLLGNVVAGYRYFCAEGKGTVLIYSLMKLNACSLLALFDSRTLKEITGKIFWQGKKNVMTMHAGTEEHDIDRKVWEIPVIRWTLAGPT
jgi:hypothetical protein